MHTFRVSLTTGIFGTSLGGAVLDLEIFEEQTFEDFNNVSK